MLFVKCHCLSLIYSHHALKFYPIGDLLLIVYLSTTLVKCKPNQIFNNIIVAGNVSTKHSVVKQRAK